ncbi:MAG: sulfite exporter TauE/SafE family protein [Armatimonadetes bacterium]|nr:sulfite exporter TauE/SafE family protein [Armatimonadota bacterium]
MTGLAIGFSKAGVAGFMTLVGPAVTALRGAAFANGMPLPLLVLGDIFVLWRFRGKWDLSVIRPMLPGALIGIALTGVFILGGLVKNPRLFNQAIGVIALCFCALQLYLEYRKARRAAGVEHLPAPPAVGFAAGGVTGMLSTIANQGGLVTNLYLLSQNLTKERFVASGAVLYFFINSSKVPFFCYHHEITRHTLLLDLVGAPFVILGGFLGASVLKHINERVFNQLILWMTVITGLKLLIWP